jgi:hypothetical protein
MIPAYGSEACSDLQINGSEGDIPLKPLAANEGGVSMHYETPPFYLPLRVKGLPSH